MICSLSGVCPVVSVMMLASSSLMALCRWFLYGPTCSHHDNGHFDHTLTCKFGPYRNQRHNAIRDELANIITDTTGHTPLKEQIIHRTNGNNQTTNDDSTLNRSEITFQTPTTTYHIHIMVTSATTLTAQAGAMTAGYPSVLGEQAKRRKYGNRPVTPAVMEVHCHVGKTPPQFLTQLSSPSQHNENKQTTSTITSND
jgi:hypothetical protein